MIKSELIQKIAIANPHLYQREIEQIVNGILEEIISALTRDDRVELRGFGAFTVKHRAARQSRNPRTGETVFVDEKFVPFFRTGKDLKKRLNRNYSGGGLLTHGVGFHAGSIPEGAGEAAMYEGEDQCDRGWEEIRPGVAEAQFENLPLMREQKTVQGSALKSESHGIRHFRIEAQKAIESPTVRATQDAGVVFARKRIGFREVGENVEGDRSAR